jgi:hypothetical protein
MQNENNVSSKVMKLKFTKYLHLKSKFFTVLNIFFTLVDEEKLFTFYF